MLITLLRAMARRRPSRNDDGATAVEYALLVGLIAVIIISSVTLLGSNIDAMGLWSSPSAPPMLAELQTRG
jgi:pilus assembly protein Flp/PilA